MILLTLVWVRMGTKLNPLSYFFKQLKIRKDENLYFLFVKNIGFSLDDMGFLKRAGISPSRKMTKYFFACYFFDYNSLCMYVILKYSILVAYHLIKIFSYTFLQIVWLRLKSYTYHEKNVHATWKYDMTDS